MGIDDNYKYQFDNAWLTNQEFDIIKDWHHNLDKYDSPKNDDYDHVAILENAKWLDIIKRGQIMKSKLIGVLNEIEKKILTNEINYF